MRDLKALFKRPVNSDPEHQIRWRILSAAQVSQLLWLLKHIWTPNCMYCIFGRIWTQVCFFIQIQSAIEDKTLSYILTRHIQVTVSSLNTLTHNNLVWHNVWLTDWPRCAAKLHFATRLAEGPHLSSFQASLIGKIEARLFMTVSLTVRWHLEKHVTLK